MRRQVAWGIVSATTLLASYFLGATIGAPSYIVPSLASLGSIKSAKVFDGTVSADQFVGVLDISAIGAHLSNAEWTNERLHRKGAYVLSYGDDRQVFVSVYGQFFWLNGTPGYFVVREADKEEFRRQLQRQVVEPIHAWRHKRNIQSGR